MITDLAHWQSEDDNNKQLRVVSVSREDTVNIHDEDQQDSHKSCRYKMNQHKASVNSLSILPGTEILASCSDDGSIFLTNLVSYRQELLYKPLTNQSVEMKKVLFLDLWDCLVATDSIGTVYFIGVGMSKFKQKIILEKVYRTTSLTNKEEQFPIMALSFYAKEQLLFLGDELGNITIWDISSLIEKVQEHRVEEKKTKLLKKRFENTEEDKNNDSNFFETAPNIQGDTKANRKTETYQEEDIGQIFFPSDIEEAGYYRKAHQDGITWIEICKEQGFFATSSFDCCCYIWNYREATFKESNQNTSRLEIYKVGSLILGLDKNWGFYIDEEARRQQALEEANLLLEEVKKVQMDQDEEESEKQQQQKEKPNAKQTSNKLLDVLHERAFKKKTVIQQKNEKSNYTNEDEDLSMDKRLKNAKKTLDFHHAMKKKINAKNLSQYDADDLIEPVNFVEGLTKDLYQQDDYENEEDDYNILNDLQDYKNQQLSGGGAFTSKNAFKTKLIKGHNKIKFK